MKNVLFIVFVLHFLISCTSSNNHFTAQQIVDKTIASSQMNKIANAKLSFEFRGRTYTAERNQGNFILKRITKSGTETLTDILSNSGFKRLLNGNPMQVLDSMTKKYSESVNSVHYFSVLPYGLNDSAVNKKVLPSVTINKKEYHKVEITFNRDGGGVDFEDIFVYWIEKKHFKIKYLAYQFHVNGGGKRFREVRKEHLVQGVRFADYNNYKPYNPEVDVRDLDKTFEKGGMTKISEIILENIQLTFSDKQRGTDRNNSHLQQTP